MIGTYQDFLSRYGNERQLRNALAKKQLFRIAHGFYSDEPGKTAAYVAKRYPEAIFTGRSAFYHYGLSDLAPSKFELASLLGTTRISEDEIKQHFQIAAIFPLGRTVEEGIPYYNRERLLIELFRLKKAYPFDYWKEVLTSYRGISSQLDFFKIVSYLQKMRGGEKILFAIREAL